MVELAWRQRPRQSGSLDDHDKWVSTATDGGYCRNAISRHIYDFKQISTGFTAHHTPALSSRRAAQ